MQPVNATLAQPQSPPQGTARTAAPRPAAPAPVVASPAPVVAVAAPVPVPAAPAPVAAAPAAPNVQPLAVAPTAVSGPPVAARTNALADTLLGEVQPSQQALTASLRRTGLEPVAAPDAAALQARLDRLAPAAACVPVVLAPAAGRPGTTWVDLTGDGLIVSAVASTHVAAVFGRAGATAEAGSHCLAPASVKELLGSVPRTAGAAPSMKLVRVAQGWQLVAPPPPAAAVRTPALPKKQARTSGRPIAKG